MAWSWGGAGGGAAAGAQAGSSFGPYGTVIGGAIGAIGGGLLGGNKGGGQLTPVKVGGGQTQQNMTFGSPYAHSFQNEQSFQGVAPAYETGYQQSMSPLQKNYLSMLLSKGGGLLG